jgi:hypothetical protein
MKKINRYNKTILHIITLLTFVYSQSQIPKIQWEKKFGGSKNEKAKSIQVTEDGGYVIVGTTNSKDGDFSRNHGKEDIWIFKLDSKGSLQWQKTYGGSQYDEPKCIKSTKDGGFILIGNTHSNDGDIVGYHGGFSDIWVIKLDSVGNLQWQKTYGGTSLDKGESIEQTKDGGYILVSSTLSNDGDIDGYHGGKGHDYWIAKIDMIGDIQWKKTLGGTCDDEAKSIICTIDSGYIIAGTTCSNDGDITFNNGLNDFWIVKLNSEGDLQWQKSIGSNFRDWARCISQTNEGGYVIGGFSYDIDYTYTHKYFSLVINIDSKGNELWKKYLKGDYYYETYNVKQSKDDSYIVTGFEGGGNNYWFSKLNKKGDLLWEKKLNGHADRDDILEESNDGSFILINSIKVETENNYEEQIRVLKLNKF